MLTDTTSDLDTLEADPLYWRLTLFDRYLRNATGQLVPSGPHHEQLWEWVWALEKGTRPRPFVGVWNRDGAKALATETPIPTPTGWSLMGDLMPGDTVFDHNGHQTTVVGVSDVSVMPAARLRFSDGSTIVASLGHRWSLLGHRAKRHHVDQDWATDVWPQRHESICVFDACGARRKGRRLCSAHTEQQRHGWTLTAVVPRSTRDRSRYQALVLTTGELLASDRRWGIPVAGPLDTSWADLPIDPYVLGVWLGDGHTAANRVTAGAQDREALVGLLAARTELQVHDRPGGVADITLSGLRGALVAEGLLGNKHVPAAYLRASASQRLDLLRGLLDTDGTPGAHGRSVSFTSTRQNLALSVTELARSLGCRPKVTEGRATLDGKDCGPVWRVHIAGASADLFGLPRKARTVESRSANARHWTGRVRYLESVTPVPDQPVRCITVDAPGRLFLAGEQMIPTHNSTNAELATVAVGARGTRRFVWYISDTQNQANKHVDTISSMLESAAAATFYPDLARRSLSKYGHSRGWRSNRLRTASGFTVDGIGLDTAQRGVRVEEARPDLMVFDDIDDLFDSPRVTLRKLNAITRTLIPAGSSDDLAILAIQNLVHPGSIFAQLVTDEPPFIADRILSGPVRAINDIETEQIDGRWRVTGGEPSWVGFDRATADGVMVDIGLTAFMSEYQHDVAPAPGGMFDHLDFTQIRRDWADLPDLVRVVVWVDPAVTDTDQSDSHAIQADGIDSDGYIWRLFSWEQRGTPKAALKRAVLKAVELGAECVGVETDQGGDLWRDEYRMVTNDMIDKGEIRREEVPPFREAKAGAGAGPKTHRASLVLADYERDRIRHLRGTHAVLEAALRRFPRTKPLDLVDAGYWSWADLRNRGEIAALRPELEEGYNERRALEEAYSAERQSWWR